MPNVRPITMPASANMTSAVSVSAPNEHRKYDAAAAGAGDPLLRPLSLWFIASTIAIAAAQVAAVIGGMLVVPF